MTSELDRGDVPGIDEPGYHRLLIGEREIVLAIAPRSAPSPGERVWGLAAQVYGLRRSGDGGIGDTLSVAQLAEQAAKRGADMIALSPMHALFTAQPGHYGPYSPSSRLFLNPLLASAELVLGEEAVRAAIAQTGLGDELRRAGAPGSDRLAVSRAGAADTVPCPVRPILSHA